jgi:hypothetical protein
VSASPSGVTRAPKATRLRGRHRLDQAKDLYLLAAQTCGLLAWQTGNLGNYR